MKWIEVKIKTTEEAYDAISEMLTSIGAGGVAIEDPNEIRREIEKPDTLDYADDEFLNALGSDVTIKAYFPEQTNRENLFQLINEKIGFISKFINTGKGFEDYTLIDDEDWSTAWKKYYKPFHISDRIIIKPSWEEYKTEKDEIVIELDPGMAFGTGTHETTKMCAQILDKYVKTGDTVLDVGCGTGILSIISAKLGAEQITAIDVDEVAVRVTKENSKLNKVDKAINAFKGVLEDIEAEKVDIVVANIIANVIIDISKSVPKHLKPGGYFVTSGIIRERKDEVIETYVKTGFEMIEEADYGEWVAMVFKCQDSL